MSQIKFPTAILLGLSIIASPVTASAEVSDWISEKKINGYFKNLVNKGLIPTRIKCERDYETSKGQKTALKYKITSKKQTGSKVEWDWKSARNIESFDIRMKTQGYKLVSRSHVSRYGTTLAKCYLYHKK